MGAANAGHTLYVPEGDGWKKCVMQQIPCAAYANPDAQLYIGPGALITPEIYQREAELLARWRFERDLGALGYADGADRLPLLVDPRAHVITDDHIEREQDTDLAQRIGSTSTIAREGIGSAQAARVMREESCVTVYNGIWPAGPFPPVGAQLGEVPPRLHEALERGENVLLEGTQGTGLSLTTGDFPYVTSRNTTSAGLAADCGVAPNRLERVILVCRTYPIRVAGNSGPFWFDSEEVAWDDIGVDPESERTTVTKKVRRVATFSYDQVREAAQLNGATEIALTFCDYVSPELAGATTDYDPTYRSDRLAGMVAGIESATGVPVTYLGTGPHSVIELVR